MLTILSPVARTSAARRSRLPVMVSSSSAVGSTQTFSGSSLISERVTDAHLRHRTDRRGRGSPGVAGTPSNSRVKPCSPRSSPVACGTSGSRNAVDRRSAAPWGGRTGASWARRSVRRSRSRDAAGTHADVGRARGVRPLAAQPVTLGGEPAPIARSDRAGPEVGGEDHARETRSRRAQPPRRRRRARARRRGRSSVRRRRRWPVRSSRSVPGARPWPPRCRAAASVPGTPLRESGRGGRR